LTQQEKKETWEEEEEEGVKGVSFSERDPWHCNVLVSGGGNVLFFFHSFIHVLEVNCSLDPDYFCLPWDSSLSVCLKLPMRFGMKE